jgi:hypothetical protein
MNLNYAKGTKVVITTFGKHKVGIVVERAISKRGIAHTIETEDGKIYESVFVNNSESVYINRTLSGVFLKSQEDGNDETEIYEDKE